VCRILAAALLLVLKWSSEAPPTPLLCVILLPVPRFIHPSRWPRRWPLWIALGILLRLYFIWFPRTIDDDISDYLGLGRNLLQHGIYGLGSGAHLAPSLFRLPGYPIVLAVCNQLFGNLPHGGWLIPLYLFQSVIDIVGGLLLAAFAYRLISPRAGEIALALAMLCPFTAAEAGTAMTECLSIFAVSLGIYAAGRILSADAAGLLETRAVILAGSAAALAMLLRPDGVLLFAALAAGLFLYILRGRSGPGFRIALCRGLTVTSVFCAIALSPLAVWTVRNWVDFQVFEPLPPRYIGDPGDRANVGMFHWIRTWSYEYESTAVVFWQVGDGPIDPVDLPARAFDSPAQRAQTLALIDEYNHTISVSADLDHCFGQLAAERIRAHPFRYYIALPLARIADMMFRPRTEEFELEVFWWPAGDHRGQTAWAIFFGLLNLFYVAAAAWAFLRRRVPWPWMLGGYILLRCLLLGSIENSEPRYTLECFPIFIIAAAAILSGSKLMRVAPSFSAPLRKRVGTHASSPTR
jgi:hypothetical protein